MCEQDLPRGSGEREEDGKQGNSVNNYPRITAEQEAEVAPSSKERICRVIDHHIACGTQVGEGKEERTEEGLAVSLWEPNESD